MLLRQAQNGEVLTGLQGHLRTDGEATLLMFDGKEVRLLGEEAPAKRSL